MSRITGLVTLIIAAVGMPHLTPAMAQNVNGATSESSGASRCSAILLADLSHIEDAPTQINSTKVVDAKDSDPSYCRVRGYVSPQVGFEIRLPLSIWNGKFFEVGCGGFCGSSDGGFGEPFFCHLDKGYACIMTDLGHGGVGGGKWGYMNNLQAQIDYGFRGPHVTALAGKAITEYFYGKAPSKSYFQGCSDGGQNALSEAQRYPWDFDGILAGDPSPTMTWTILWVWAQRALTDASGRPLLTYAEMEMVHSAAVSKCAVGDGAKHGFIEDPRACRFDPSSLLCRAAKTPECLSDIQVQAIKKVYAGPTNSKGERIYPGGTPIGSELNWIDGIDGEGDAYVASKPSLPVGLSPVSAIEDYFRYLAFTPAPGPSWKLADFDFDRDYKRMSTSESLMGASNNPDLRKFKAAGGKMILYQGWADHSDVPQETIEYYETTERAMGGRASTQDFFRMFVIPGMHHCSGGAGAFAIDYLKYLEAWVERNEPPDAMIGAHLSGPEDIGKFLTTRFPLDPSTAVSFTRPVYPYPLIAKYKGTGSIDDAANFVSVMPKQ